MQHKYYIADVFTDKPFNGAQIAVFPSADALNNEQMQLIARELNLSETVFVFPNKSAANQYQLKLFAPTHEIDFAGHPIIAAGFVLAQIKSIEQQGKYTDVQFTVNSGEIDVNVTYESNQPVLTQFKLQSEAIVDRYVPADNQLAEMLSVDEVDIEKLKYHTLLVSAQRTYLIIPMRSFAAVRHAKFNYAAWSRSIAPVCMTKEILLFSSQSDNPSSTFHARLVGPDIGVYDDPPIASAMPSFTAYLASRESTTAGSHTFVIDRGETNTRKSILSIEMDTDDRHTVKQIRVGGAAVLIGEGKIIAP